MSVLIVEDDELLLKVMEYQVEALELSVRSARTGKIALEMIEAKVPTILILDVSLPDMSAFEIIDSLRQNPNTSSIPVLIHTSLDLTLEERSKLQLGPTQIVTKAAACSDAFEQMVLELIPLQEQNHRKS